MGTTAGNLGGYEMRLRERGVDARGWGWAEQLLQDVRFGVRTLRKSPGFTTAAIVTLALATGATTAIFSIVHGVLLRPLPFRDPDRLVEVFGRTWGNDRDQPDPMTAGIGAPELLHYQTQSVSFDAFTGYEVTTRHLYGDATPERLNAVAADLNFFSVLGVDAVAGRPFNTGDPLDVAVISERLWERRFARQPLHAGTTLTLDNRTVTLLGVLPSGFQFPYGAASLMPGALPESRTDVWVPMPPLRAAGTAQLRQGRVSVVARLKPAVSLSRASVELNMIAGRVEQQEVATSARHLAARLVPLTEVVVGPARRSLWMLFAAVGLVLAAACANVGNLLLARMTVRVREIVTRAALGASALRLLRQFLAESLLLGLAGGLAGAAVARWGTTALVAIVSARVPRANEVVLDWRAFAFLLVVCLVAAVLFGLAPALAAARVNIQAITREGGGHVTRAGSFTRLRDGLVILEVALAFLLATGAALVVREIVRLQHVPTGMAVENVVSLHLTPKTTAREYYEIEERVAQIPAVHAAGFTQLTPLQNWGWDAQSSIRSRPAAEPFVAGLRYVTPGYFRTLGIPIVRGRGLTAGDAEGAPSVILINAALARQFFPDEDPVGQELNRGTIVGVVGDVRQVALDRDAAPELYYPAAQNVTMAPDIGMSLLVRTDGRPELAVDAIRSAVRAVNPMLAVSNVKRMEQIVTDSLWELNLYRWLIGSFAALALLLATIGLYGVISFATASRIREFAVRLALGSEPGRLVRLVLARGLLLVAGGVAAGFVAALLLRPSLREVSSALAGDPVTYASTAIVLAAIGLFASAVPAWRAARVDVSTVLRHE